MILIVDFEHSVCVTVKFSVTKRQKNCCSAAIGRRRLTKVSNWYYKAACKISSRSDCWLPWKWRFWVKYGLVCKILKPCDWLNSTHHNISTISNSGENFSSNGTSIVSSAVSDQVILNPYTLEKLKKLTQYGVYYQQNHREMLSSWLYKTNFFKYVSLLWFVLRRFKNNMVGIRATHGRSFVQVRGWCVS